MTTKYINGSGLSKLLQLISNSVGQALNSISNKLSNIDNTHANLIDVTYDELRDMRNNGYLIPGQYYCITDYVTTTNQENTISNGYNHSIVVLATDTNRLSEEAMTYDGYKVWYCLDNDTNRFAWAGATKSVLEVDCMFNAGTESDPNTIIVIFRRDESLVIEENDVTYYGYTSTGVILGSSTPLFNTDTVLWYTEEFPEIGDRVNHTFYQILDGEMIPINMLSEFSESQEPIGKGVIYRMIDENGNDLPYDFKSILFKNPNDETDDKYYYTFYYKDSNNKIVDASAHSGIKHMCYNNVIKHYKIAHTMYIPNNIFNASNYCYNNTFGSDCYNNTFGSDCYNNTFGSDCRDNTFGSDCYNNTFGSNCRDNTFGSNCRDNTFGSYCYNNSFIYVNSNDSTQTETLNGIVNCNFSNHYQYNELKHLKTSNTNSSVYLKNVHFCKGINGNLNKINTITIEGALPYNVETKVAKNSKGELKIYCEADLIA